MQTKSKVLNDQVTKQRAIEEKAIQNLTDLIKKETQFLQENLQASHIDQKQREQFDSKLSDKIGWRGFSGYVADKEAKKFTTVWPTDEEWLKLSDEELG